MADYHIYDMFGFLHTAENLPSYHNRVISGMPVGAVAYALRYPISELLRLNPIALAFDCKFTPGSPRKLPGYKKNRQSPSPWLLIQAEFLYDMLLECGIPCFRGNGEADDHVHGLWLKAKEFINQDRYGEIVIHGVDYDLCHNIDSHTRFNAANRQVQDVTPITYRNILADKATGTPCLLGTISAKKVFTYDRSDSINSFSSKSGKSGIEIYKEFCDFLTSHNCPVSIMQDISALEIFITSFYPEDAEVVMKRARAIYPKDLSKSFSYNFASKLAGDRYLDVNFELLYKYAKVLNLSTLKQAIERSFPKFSMFTEDDVLPQRDKVYSYGNDYKSGVFSADFNIGPVSSFTKSESVSLLGGLLNDLQDDYVDEE